MRVKMLSLFMVLGGCDQAGPAPAEAVDAALEVPTKDAPGEQTPAEEDPSEEATFEEAPGAPSEEAPAEEAPDGEAPAEALTPEAVAEVCDACSNRCDPSAKP